MAGLAALIVVAPACALLIDGPAVLESLQGWTLGLGGLAPAAYALFYVVATLLGAPTTPLVAVAAVLFGPVRALILMGAAGTLSALLAFRIARSAARPALAARLRGNPAYGRLCRLIERHGALVIPFIRLTPVLPFAAVNYGLGLTRIGFWQYALWSGVAILAGDALLVLGAAWLYDALSGAEPSRPALVGAVAALAAVIGLAAASRRRGVPVPCPRSAATVAPARPTPTTTTGPRGIAMRRR